MLWKPVDTITEAREKLEKWNNIFNTFYLVCTKEDEAIGFISVNEVDTNIYGDLGIAIGENYVNKGYGSEILSELIDYLKLHGAKKIYYSHLKENECSRKLALKFSFEYYKCNKVIRKYDNKEFEEMFYVLNLKN